MGLNHLNKKKKWSAGTRLPKSWSYVSSAYSHSSVVFLSSAYAIHSSLIEETSMKTRELNRAMDREAMAGDEESRSSSLPHK